MRVSINHSIFTAKWIYSKMRYRACACSLAVTQSAASAWLCASRNCKRVQPWQETAQAHWQDARDAELLRRAVLMAERVNMQVTSHRSILLCYWPHKDTAASRRPVRRPSLSVLTHTALSNAQDTAFDQGRQKRSDPLNDRSLWLSGKGGPAGDLHWLVAWLSSFAALQCNLA